MFKDKINVQAIGTLKISDKETEPACRQENARSIQKYGVCSGFCTWWQTNKRKQYRRCPYINWMAFGNGGSSSTTTLSYPFPRVFTTYDELSNTSSNSTLYSKTYQQQVATTVFDPTEGGSK